MDTDGQAWCWGYNESATLGLGTYEPVTTPTRSAVFSDATDIHHGFFVSCVERNAKHACIGEGGELFPLPDDAPRCRGGHHPCSPQPVALPVTGGKMFLDQVACVDSPANPGALRCWGSNDTGLIVPGRTQPPDTAQELDFGVDSIQDFVATIGWVCVVSPPRSLVCLGANSTPGGDWFRQTYEAPDTIVSLDAFKFRACLVAMPGNVYCWGDSDSRRSRAGSTPAPYDEVLQGLHQIAVSNVQQVSVGAAHSCALTTDGDVYCWGANDTGQLGRRADGEHDTWHDPVRVDGLPPAVQVEVIGRATCALTHDREVYCWGNNDFGQVGVDSNSPFYDSPQRVRFDF